MHIIDGETLKTRTRAGELVTGVVNVETQIKGCAVELTVGSIFVPGAKGKDVGSADVPRAQLSLAQGQTALVRTLQTVHLKKNQACVAFPASGVSIKGLLMTNPGYVDPYYEGPLHVTVINFGSEPYPLLENGRLLRAIFFEQDTALTQTDYPKNGSPVTLELLQRLSHDFLDVDKRATAAANKASDRADRRTKFWTAGASILVAVIAIGGNWYYNNIKLEDRMLKVETLAPTLEKISSLEARLQKLEASPRRVR